MLVRGSLKHFKISRKIVAWVVQRAAGLSVQWVNPHIKRSTQQICCYEHVRPDQDRLVYSSAGKFKEPVTIMYMKSKWWSAWKQCALRTGKYASLSLCIQTTKTKCTTDNTSMTLSYPAYVGWYSTGYSTTTQEQVCLAPIVLYNCLKTKRQLCSTKDRRLPFQICGVDCAPRFSFCLFVLFNNSIREMDNVAVLVVFDHL